MNLPRVDHTAIVVKDIEEAVARYRALLGAAPGQRLSVTDQGVDVVFLDLGDTQIELVQPTRPGTGIARFLDQRGEGLHHIGILVADIQGELERLTHQGVELIDHEPRVGAHGRVAFVHPRGSGGPLIELVGAEMSEPVGPDSIGSV